jgi:hypothetical protein
MVMKVVNVRGNSTNMGAKVTEFATNFVGSLGWSVLIWLKDHSHETHNHMCNIIIYQV